jgi:hypothetical protein
MHRPQMWLRSAVAVWFADHAPNVSDHQETQMKRKTLARWAARLSVVAVFAATAMFTMAVVASNASLIDWGLGR